MNAVPWRMGREHRDYRYVASKPINPPRGIYRVTEPDYVDIFYSRLHRWMSETYFSSSIAEIERHPDYIAIVAMGRHAIPLIISELRKSPSLLVFAAQSITGETPYLKCERGNIKAMTNAWISWSERQSASP
jgi:hypothetical protein